jgi:hypothetical protein
MNHVIFEGGVCDQLEGGEANDEIIALLAKTVVFGAMDKVAFFDP